MAEEITTSSEYPISSKKSVRIAAQLSALPVELIEPVIAELPLQNIFQLYCASTAGPNLRNAVETCPAWAWLLSDNCIEISRLWVAMNRLSMLWCGRGLVQESTRLWTVSCAALQGISGERVLRAAEQKETDPGKRIMSKVRARFVRTFESFIGAHHERKQTPHRRFNLFPTWGRGLKRADRRAFCMFLPKWLLSTLIDEDKLADEIDSTPMPLTTASEYLVNAPDIEFLDDAADAMRSHTWTMHEALLILPWIVRAHELLRQAKSNELLVMSRLHDQFPDVLKMPLAPQSQEKSIAKHISRNLRTDAKKAATRAVNTKLKGMGEFEPNHHVSRPWFRFRYAHSCLVPYNWAFELFYKISSQYIPSAEGARYPEEVKSLFPQVQEGLEYIYSHSKTPIRRVVVVNEQMRFIVRPEQNFGLPVPPKELTWLGMFLKCVDWIRNEFPDEYDASYRAGLTSDADYRTSSAWASMDAVDYEKFGRTGSVFQLARTLSTDSDICDEYYRGNTRKQPSLLALYIDAISPDRKSELMLEMFPAKDLGIETRSLLFDSMLSKITTVLKRNPLSSASSSELGEEVESTDSDGVAQADSAIHHDLQVCEKILEGLLLDQDAEGNKSISSVLDQIRSKMSHDTPVPPPATQKHSSVRLCYICRRQLKEAHSLFPSMCPVCGDFNLSSSRLSQPHSLKLFGRTALVTGGRVNLGFHVALRLLRCGASVIVTTRYPADAVMRYRREADSEVWEARLRIIGADFRSAADAMALVKEVKLILDWNYYSSLDILINNAAQTLTDTREAELAAVEREQALLEGIPESRYDHWLRGTDYKARLRGVAGGALDAAAYGGLLESSTEADASTSGNEVAKAGTSADQSLVQHSKSSWVQSLDEIPYEDIITAHSVNTFVPLILIRELRDSMRQRGGREHAAHVVNVSSREGIFETRRNHPAKRAKHVHTNMSKAGLNMITETEAADMWEKDGIAMNTVDPGYMSAAPEMEAAFDGERPIGWEDGAGRVLWPIAVGDKARKSNGKVIWGQFLKHYGAVRVEPGYGPG